MIKIDNLDFRENWTCIMIDNPEQHIHLAKCGHMFNTVQGDNEFFNCSECVHK